MLSFDISCFGNFLDRFRLNKINQIQILKIFENGLGLPLNAVNYFLNKNSCLCLSLKYNKNNIYMKILIKV